MLNEPYLLLLDLVHPVELTKQGGVDSVVPEVSVEQDAALLDGLTNSFMQSIISEKKVYVLRLEEAHTISLTNG